MFDIFGTNRRRQDKLMAVLELNAQFKNMQKVVPAAAWFFARSLLNSKQLLVEKISTKAMIGHLKTAINSKSAEISTRADGGMWVCAMEFLISYFRSMEKNENLMAYQDVMSEIAKGGESYRELSEKDFKPPLDEFSRNMFQNDGIFSLAELVQKIKTEGNSNGIAENTVNESVMTIMAAHDIREENSCHVLYPEIIRLKEIISRT